VAHDHKSNENEKIVYVGDSRVRKNTKVYLPRDYSAYPGKSEAFVPNFLLKEWMVGAVVLVGFMVLVMAHPSPLGYPADPTNTAFIPMPDWYFLFLYQLLKYPYMSDNFVVLGTVIVPGLAFGALTIAPFLDTGKERRFYKRPIASSLMLLSLVSIVYLTVVSWSHYTHELERMGITPEHIERAEKLAAGKEVPKAGGAKKDELVALVGEDDPAFQIYQKATCVACHGDQLKGNPKAGIPALRGIGDVYTQEQLMDIIKKGIGSMSGQYEANIGKGLTDEDLNNLAGWLAKQKKQE
jgi:menaquinol-cytochrome c reductase cytochrome b/c subunit